MKSKYKGFSLKTRKSRRRTFNRPTTARVLEAPVAARLHQQHPAFDAPRGGLFTKDERERSERENHEVHPEAEDLYTSTSVFLKLQVYTFCRLSFFGSCRSSI